jgi:uncharacterized membrane protein YgaE (UPF0421/DUF939 family)
MGGAVGSPITIGGMAEFAERLRLQWLSLLQAAVAATASWAMATEVLGHVSPIFAPLSAIIAISAGYGRRLALVVEIVAGVALGILVADLIVEAIGTGIWQLGLVTLAAMVVAVGLGAKPMVVTQAAISAMLVVTVQPPGSGQALPRFVDALVGGVVALIVTALLTTDPLTSVKRASESLLDELAAVLEDVATALEARHAEGVVAALMRARALESRELMWRQSVEAGREMVRTAPPQRHARDELAAYEQAVAGIDLAIRNVRVLVRGALRAVELDEPVPPEICAAMRHLAAAVGTLGSDLERPDEPNESRTLALRAAAEATEAHAREGNLSVSVMAGQIRSTAVDLLRGLGELPGDARAAIRAASDQA